VGGLRRNDVITWIAIISVIGAFCVTVTRIVWTRHLPFAEWREVLGSRSFGGWVGPKDDILPSGDPAFAPSRHESYQVEVRRHVAHDDWALLEARLPLGILLADEPALRRVGCHLARAVRADPAMAEGGLPVRFVLEASGNSGDPTRRIEFALTECTR
jgi:hypothetical protein